MKQLGNLPDRFLTEILGQPDAIRRAADGLLDQADTLAAVRRVTGAAGAVVFTGMGASYDACHVPVTLLAASGHHAVIVDAAELLHFRLPSLRPDTVLVCVSQSGESAEPVALLEAVAARPSPLAVVTVTNGLDNPLARADGLHLDLRTGEEEGPSTMTFAASVLVLAALAGTDPGDGERTATALERLLERPEERAADLRHWLGERTTLVTLGRGCARAASEMAALVLKEAAHLPAEALEAGQFRHGPLELAGPEMAALVVATEPATYDLDVALAEDVAATGGGVLLASATGDAPDGVQGFALGDVPPALAPVAGVVPAQLLAWRLAGERNIDPCAFAVGAKVTREE